MISIQKANQLNGNMIKNSIINNYSTFDELKRMLDGKQYNLAMEYLNKLNEFAGIYHPMYPYYKIDSIEINNKLILVSKPLSPEAEQAFPQTYIGKFKFSEEYSKFKSVEEILQYSKNTQKDVAIDMLELKKMIGDCEDPFQDEIKELGLLESNQWYIKHEEFPIAKPYKILIGDTNVSFDYILLRATKIIDNCVYLSNVEQNGPFLVEFVFNFVNRSIEFKIKVNDNFKTDYSVIIDYLLFTKAISVNQTLKLVSLEENSVLASGEINTTSYKGPFKDVDMEIEFFRAIKNIENKFLKKITLPELLDEQSNYNISYLNEGIIYGKVTGTWTNANLQIGVTEDTKKLAHSITDKFCEFVFSMKREFFIYGEIFTVSEIRTTYYASKIKNIDKIIKKIEYADIGDVISLELESGEDKRCMDEFTFL